MIGRVLELGLDMGIHTVRIGLGSMTVLVVFDVGIGSGYD